MKQQKFSVNKYKPSDIAIYRGAMKKMGYELVNITPLCEFRLGNSGWCNEFNEPDEEVYHIQIHYRKEPIARCNGKEIYIIDDDLYCVYQMPEKDTDFIIFRKVPLEQRKDKPKRRKST